ncbi:sigma factor-like helix-turn-helix DNA-binding protein [Terrisporobacter sp.]|uniref:sigma factor-like helix-turn-helix DNA-binding protein n=1 Tax=Terrisporobacter sp. TaxID=1965305 RepID=UPI002899C16F|nr:sigma factor-like helix-turn-helix DNA-binding protein [Terrisporobacter sp.]
MTQRELEQFASIQKEIEDIREIQNDLKEKQKSIKSQIITDMPKGGGSALTMEDIVANIELNIVKIAKKQLELANFILKMENNIESLESQERRLIRYRYINGLPFYQIAMKMHYSERHVKRLHKEILNKMA